MSYKQARGWADMIHEVVSDDRMPPWHADAPRGHFRNDRRLSEEQKKMLLAWVDQGCPEGDPKDAPPEKKYQEGWRLGREPDVVLSMNRPVNVPAQYLYGLAGMPYQYVAVGEPFKEDTWVQAVEIRPDDGVYDYTARYTAGSTEFVVPAKIADDVAADCARAAETIHRALGLRDLSRSDLIIDGEGRVWFLEVNVAPGLTETSTVPLSVQAAGLDLGALVGDLVQAAVARSRDN